MINLITRIFNPARYWRNKYRDERCLRILAENREAEAVHINEIRLHTILGHERGNAEMRGLLASAYTMIHNLECELQNARAQLAPFKTPRARDERGHFLKDTLQ